MGSVNVAAQADAPPRAEAVLRAEAGPRPDAGRADAGPLLTVSGLSVSFGWLRALEDVNLSVQTGEFVALAGENGAGKTTLVRCIAGEVVPASGEVFFAGRRMPADQAAAVKQGIAVVWQDLALCDNLDVAANIMLGQERRRLLLSETRFHMAAAELLASLRIPLSDTTRNVRTLPGGQRQLVAVARAMGRKPRLLALDEPTASLGVNEAAQVEELIMRLRQQGTTILLACHDIDQMFRLANRIVVLRQGRIVGEVRTADAHPDDVIALISGRQPVSSAQQQLTRLHGLTDRLVSADPSSSLSLILSALGAALGSERLCIHLLADSRLVFAASLGLAPPLLSPWSDLPLGPAGGPAVLAAAAQDARTAEDVQVGAAWAPFAELAKSAKVASSWSVPVLGPGGLLGVITVFRATAGKPQRDDLDLATLYAGYAASAIERDRLLDEVTSRNRVLETIREILETLAGPIPVADGLDIALQLLRRGLEADEVALIVRQPDGPPTCRACDGMADPADPDAKEDGPAASPAARHAAAAALAQAGQGDVAVQRSCTDRDWLLSVAFPAPGGLAALVARWQAGPPPADSAALLEDAAHSLRLALEREEAWFANQETAALRRSRELQRGFLSRLSHELRTPLTAIRGYASSLLQTDVTWDDESEQRFLTRIAAESSRLGRLVDDLLRFSAIESGILQLQRDWCDISLVLDAAIACLPPSGALLVSVRCAAGLPPIWADHDRLEQVFVNLLTNAVGHNPPGTRVLVTAIADGPGTVTVRVADDGDGMAAELMLAPFEPRPRHRTRRPGAGLGLSIAKGIVAAHGGGMELVQPGRGTCFEISLPVENPENPAADAPAPDGRDEAPVAGGTVAASARGAS